MSEDCDCEENGEEETEEEADTVKQAEMQAGMFYVSAEGDSTEESVEALKELWDKGISEIEEMDKEKREKIHLQ